MANKAAARSPFDPSRFVFEESSKRPAGRAVRFGKGEASFTEQAVHTTSQVQRRRAPPKAALSWSKLSPSLRVLPLVLLFIAILAYAPIPTLPDIHSPGFAAARRHFSAVFFPQPQTQCMPQGHIPTALHDLAHEVATLARWGPVGFPDYALRMEGGKIFFELTSTPDERSSQPSAATSLGPEVVIDEDLTIGRCWTVPIGGQIGLSTPTIIYPHHITIDHIPRQVAMDIGKAPRRMVLWGVVDGLSNVRRLGALLDDPRAVATLESPALNGRSSPPLSALHAFVALAVFEYDISQGPIQTFPLSDYIVDSHMDFGLFVLEIIDNWGASDTCLYRVRIHGEPASITGSK